MLDVDATLRAYLSAQAALTIYTGQRLYASLSLPATYSPATGAAILFNVRGGSVGFEKILNPSMQFRTYAQTEAKARQADSALFDSLHDKKSGPMLYAMLETYPQLLLDPETQWPYMLSFYRLLYRNP